MTTKNFDVFLCHNSEDKPIVIEVAQQLLRRGITPWLDMWELRPGIDLQDALDEQVEQIQTVAVFVGRAGLGPWQYQEVKLFLREFVKRGCHVFPVLLKNAPKETALPRFLEGSTWVDFRCSVPDPFEQLVWGITNERPSNIVGSRYPNSRQNEIAISQKNVKRSYDRDNDKLKEDLSKLESHLQREEWLYADELTHHILINGNTLSNEENGLDIDVKIESIPCLTLVSIDRLWKNYSKEKFGFSIQRRISQEIALSCDCSDDNLKSLGVLLGWSDEKLKGKWLSQNELIFDKKKAPEGHFPWKACRLRKLLDSQISKVDRRILLVKTEFTMENIQTIFDCLSAYDEND